MATSITPQDRKTARAVQHVARRCRNEKMTLSEALQKVKWSSTYQKEAALVVSKSMRARGRRAR